MSFLSVRYFDIYSLVKNFSKKMMLIISFAFVQALFNVFVLIGVCQGI